MKCILNITGLEITSKNNTRIFCSSVFSVCSQYQTAPTHPPQDTEPLSQDSDTSGKVFKKVQQCLTGRGGGERAGKSKGRGWEVMDGRAGTSLNDCGPCRTSAGAEERAEEEGAAERIRCILTPTAVLLPATLGGPIVTSSNNMGRDVWGEMSLGKGEERYFEFLFLYFLFPNTQLSH